MRVSTWGCACAVVAVVAVGAACAGCVGPTCSSSDTTCFLDHLSVQVDMDTDIVDIPAGSTSEAQYDTSGTPFSFVPTTGAGYDLTFAGASDQVAVLVNFTDPYGARNGGCFGVHPYLHPFPGPIGTYPMRAFRSVYDQQTSGQFTLLLVAGVNPGGGQQQYAIDLYPISSPTPGQEVVAQLQAGGTIKLGQPLSIVVTVGEAGGGGGNHDGTWSGTCTTTSQAFPQPNTIQVSFGFSGGVLTTGGLGLTGSISGDTMTLTSTDSCGISFNSTGNISGSSVEVSGQNSNDPSCAVQSLTCSLTQS